MTIVTTGGIQASDEMRAAFARVEGKIDIPYMAVEWELGEYVADIFSYKTPVAYGAGETALEAVEAACDQAAKL